MGFRVITVVEVQANGSGAGKALAKINAARKIIAILRGDESQDVNDLASRHDDNRFDNIQFHAYAIFTNLMRFNAQELRCGIGGVLCKEAFDKAEVLSTWSAKKIHQLLRNDMHCR